MNDIQGYQNGPIETGASRAKEMSPRAYNLAMSALIFLAAMHLFSDGDWYKPYIDYVNVNGYMYAASPNGYVKYKDIGLLAQSLKAAGNCFEDIGITSYEDIIMITD